MRFLHDIAENERGVSILYGIMFMLLATMVSAVILSAAVSSVERVHAEQERNQNMLTLRSAGDLVRDCIKNTTCTITTETVNATNVSSVKNVQVDGSKLDLILKDAMQVACGKAGDPKDATGSFDINIDSEGAPEALKGSSVHVDFTMTQTKKPTDEDAADAYKIEAIITLKDGGQRMFLVATRSAATAPSVYTDDPAVTRTKTEVSWGTVELSTTKSKDKDGGTS